MGTTEKNICNLLRDTWFSLITLLENLRDVPKKILDQIRQLVKKLKNIVLDSIVQYAKDIVDLVKSYLTLRQIDNTQGRKSFCSLLYSCKPALDKLIEFGVIPKAVSDAIYDKSDIDKDVLKTLGFDNVNFNSNFEFFEYVACRLSTTTLLNTFIDDLINSMLEYLTQFEKYLDLDFWLNNHYIGRLIKRKIAQYEALMKTILDIINDDLEPFMDCAFAACDFSISTKNFLEDFSYKMDLEREPIPLSSISLTSRWKVSKEKITKEFSESLEATKLIFTSIKKDSDNLKEDFSKSKSEISKQSVRHELLSDTTTSTAYSPAVNNDNNRRLVNYMKTENSTV